MNIVKKINVPTGHILVVEGTKGPLELVSMGDYGKDVNLNKDSQVKDDLPLLPLTDKWVVTISTQYTCKQACKFCDVPKVKFNHQNINCTLNDLQQQVITALHLHPEVKYSNRLNIHYARMGEPTWNPYVLDHAKWMKEHIDPEYNVHPVLTTMMPKNNDWLKTMIHAWVRIKNRVYFGNAGLQISINGTNEDERTEMFSGTSLTIPEIAKLMDGTIPVGRKFTLNFPVCDWEIDPNVLLRYFNPEHYICKLTPMHKTHRSQQFGIETKGDYTDFASYKDIQKSLEKVGYQTLVFIASEDEDHGMITCGNALLANVKEPRIRTEEMKFIGGSKVGKTPFESWNNQKDPFHKKLVELNVIT